MAVVNKFISLIFAISFFNVLADLKEENLLKNPWLIAIDDEILKRVDCDDKNFAVTADWSAHDTSIFSSCGEIFRFEKEDEVLDRPKYFGLGV